MLCVFIKTTVSLTVILANFLSVLQLGIPSLLSASPHEHSEHNWQIQQQT